ncbi:polynucleotide 5'-hydroxyl-kinase [Aureococcus anophagefferens]|nr:polynucleotide 5'-hydroxyl-kinase [Aureococcus anophagefferens]
MADAETDGGTRSESEQASGDEGASGSDDAPEPSPLRTTRLSAKTSTQSFAPQPCPWRAASTGDDPETPLVVTFINKVRRRAPAPVIPNPSQPRPKTPPPKKRRRRRRRAAAAGDAEVLTVHAGITVELRDVAAANPAMVPAVEAADERLRRLPESALVFTNGRGEPDLRKNVEWQRLVAEEDALLRSYAGKRRKKPQSGDPAGSASAAPPPPGPAARAAAQAHARRRGAAPAPRRRRAPARGAYAANDGRCRLRASPTKRNSPDQPPRPAPKPVVRAPAPAAPPPAPAPAPQSENAAAREYIGRMQHLKDYQDGRGDKDAIVRRVHGLLAGYPDLIRDFYNFLPPGDRALAPSTSRRRRAPTASRPRRRRSTASSPRRRRRRRRSCRLWSRAGRRPRAPPPADYLAAPARPASVPTAFFGAHENGARDIGWAVPSTVMLAPAHAQAIAAIAAAAKPALGAPPPRAAALRGLRAAAGAAARAGPGLGPPPAGRPARRRHGSVAGLRHGPPPPRGDARRRRGGPRRRRGSRCPGPGGAVDAAVRTLGDRLRPCSRFAPPRVADAATAAARRLRAREDGRGGARRLPRDAATFALFADVAAKAAVALATNAAADDDPSRSRPSAPPPAPRRRRSRASSASRTRRRSSPASTSRACASPRRSPRSRTRTSLRRRRRRGRPMDVRLGAS